MSAATATFTRPLSFSLGFLGRFAKLFGDARRFEQLFDMSDAELAARGLSRDELVRSYIAGRGLN